MTQMVWKCGLALALLTSAATGPARAPDEVVAAERSFAAYAQTHGVNSAFHQFIADDGLLFIPDPKLGKTLLAKAPNGPGSLNWWPIYAGMAASGDLGFTTGPYVMEGPRGKAYGHFFTVWRKQPDGMWRWLLDHGTPTTAQPAEGPDAPVRTLTASGKRGQAAGAWSKLIMLEAEFAQALGRDAKAAYLSRLAEDARVMRAGPQPAHGWSAYRVRVAEGPATVTASHLGGDISKAGDLAFTYGHASWPEAGRAVKGHYIRIWQNRANGWALVVDELVPTPPPPPKPAS